MHEKSQVVNPNWIAMKNRWREIRQANSDDIVKAMIDYLIFSTLLDDDKLEHELITLDIKLNPQLIQERDDREAKFLDLINDWNKINHRDDSIKLMYSMFRRINDLHDELERRDAYSRIYIDSSGKVLYDEREWRAVKFTPSTQDQSSALQQGYLVDAENLKFSDDDIVAILVEDENQSNEIKELIRTGQTLLHYEAVKDKIYPIDRFSENQCF
jgi:hypothetical protein